MPNIPERSRMVQEVVSSIFDIQVEDLQVRNKKTEHSMARLVAVRLYLANFPYMSHDWIGCQLGYKHRAMKPEYICNIEVPKSIITQAQKLYDQMLKNHDK